MEALGQRERRSCDMRSAAGAPPYEMKSNLVSFGTDGDW